MLAGASLRYLLTLARARRAHPPPGRLMDAVEQALGPEVKAARGVEARAGTLFTQASIYRELARR